MRRALLTLSLFLALAGALIVVSDRPHAQFMTLGVGAKQDGGGCSQATAFLARTSGLDGTHTTAYTNLICGWVTDGVWTILDAVWVTATQDTTTAKLNLVSSSFTLSETGAGTALTFTADRGYINPGPTNSNARYFSTQFNPTTAPSPQYVQNAAHVSAWSALSLTTTSIASIISNNSGVGNLQQSNLYPKFTDNNAYLRSNDATPGSSGFANSNRQGFWVSNRSSSTARQAYLNGASINTYGSVTSAAPNNTLITLLYDGSGSAYNIVDTLAAASIGSNVSAVQNAFYTRLRTYMTAVGVP